MVVVDVADREDAVRPLHVIAKVGTGTGDPAATDDDVVEGLARGHEASAQDVTGNDGEASGRKGSLLEEGTTG